MTAESLGDCSSGDTCVSLDGYRYEWRMVNSENRWGLMARTLDLHALLGYELPRNLKEVSFNTDEGAEIGLVVNESTGKDAGFVAQQMVIASVGGQERSALSIAAKVISKEYQDHGIGTQLAIQAIQRHQPDIITGRTQNPYAIRAYEKTGAIKEIYPIDKDYTYMVRFELGLMLGRDRIAEISDLRTGLCKELYPRGASRAFLLDENSERVSEETKRIYRRMKEIGVDFINGDGIRYWAVVNRKFYDDPIRATFPQAA